MIIMMTILIMDTLFPFFNFITNSGQNGYNIFNYYNKDRGNIKIYILFL